MKAYRTVCLALVFKVNRPSRRTTCKPKKAIAFPEAVYDYIVLGLMDFYFRRKAALVLNKRYLFRLILPTFCRMDQEVLVVHDHPPVRAPVPDHTIEAALHPLIAIGGTAKVKLKVEAAQRLRPQWKG